MDKRGFDATKHTLLLSGPDGGLKKTPAYCISANVLKTQTSKYHLYLTAAGFPAGWAKHQITESADFDKPTRKTLRQLQAQRRVSAQPHLSMDIDGDGFVS